MNTQRFTAALVFALLCSGLLTWQLNAHLRPKVSPLRVVPVGKVTVAAGNLSAGSPISLSSLKVISLPTSQPLVGSFKDPQELTGRILLVPVASGEPILAHDLATSDSETGMAALIPNGMRAVSVRATEDQGSVSGFVAAGSHVDVLVTYRPENEATFVSSMVLQNVCVLAIGRKADVGLEAKFRSDDAVTFLVTPEEAARLTVASSLGKITFALRNGKDKELTPGLTNVSLNAAASASPKVSGSSASGLRTVGSVRTSPSGFTVETLAGGKSTVQTFQGNQP